MAAETPSVNDLPLVSEVGTGPGLFEHPRSDETAWELKMRTTTALGLIVCAGALLAAVPASAMPGTGLAAKAQAPGASSVEKIEFKRRPDGSVYYVRPNFNDNETHYFAYRGYAYPYNPGYTYRLTRGELRPSDRLRRYRIAD